MSDPVPGKPRPPVKTPKLVRDDMVKIWERFGDKVTYRYLSDFEFRTALRHKLVEEAFEVLTDPSLDEFADVLQVLKDTLREHNVTMDQVEQARVKKAADRGEFTKGLYLTSFEWGPGPEERA